MAETSFFPPLYLITDRTLAVDEKDYFRKIKDALAAGVRLIQMREKGLPAAELYRLGTILRELTYRFDAKLLINDRIDICLSLAADGVHLTETSIPTFAARKLLGPKKILGVSTHSLEKLSEQNFQGADFATFSPIFPTQSKQQYGAPQGLEALKDACQISTIPVFALGGITLERTRDCLRAGAIGVAVISAVMGAPFPARVVRDFLEQI